MTKRNRTELESNLRSILKQLLPSWNVSINIRSIINKIVMVLLLIAKVSQITPAFADNNMAEPQPIVIDAGLDNELSVSELWSALNSEQRAILLVLELQVPDLAEYLLNESPETIHAFFADAREQLSKLPLWQQIEQLSLDSNLPETLPENTKELRSYIQSDGQLSIVIANDEVEAKNISRLPDKDLEGSTSYFESTSTFTYTDKDKDDLVDKLSDTLLNEIFDDESNSS